MNLLVRFFKQIKEIEQIIAKIQCAGGTSFLVGGSVRDLILEKEIKDIDIEVHNIPLEQLEKTLKKFGSVKFIGQQFGVLRVCGLDIDWSVPRKDSFGRKPEVQLDPTMTIKEACRRRDLTMNAMAIDIGTLFNNSAAIKTIDDISIIDPFGGKQDLQNKVLREVDKELFIQDPLRFYRVMQFIGRFEMKPADSLQAMCKEMDLSGVSKERVGLEMDKLLLKSKWPSLGFRWLHEIGRLEEIFPEIGRLVGVTQRKDYHPEGDVFEHAMQSLDAAAQLDVYEDVSCYGVDGNKTQTYTAEQEKYVVALAALCHDLGKALKCKNATDSRGHDVLGVLPAKNLLHRFVFCSAFINAVCTLVRYHFQPMILLKNKSSNVAYKKLALQLGPEVSMRQLGFLAWCDLQGRNPHSMRPLKENVSFFEQHVQKVSDAGLDHGPEQAVLQGKDLIDVINPGPTMGVLLQKAYTIQIEEGIKDKEKLKKRVLKI